MKFTQYPAYQKLKELAETAPDLTKEGTISAKRVESMALTSCAWKMLYATERVDEKIQKALCELATDAKVQEKMGKLQNMAVMNFVKNVEESENRRVGHTAIRNPQPGEEFSKEVTEASKIYSAELEKLKKFLPKVERYKNMIVVGIGGSYLATKAMLAALSAYQTKDRKLYFASNVDPDKIASLLEKVDLRQTLVAIVSKSGGTLEIQAQEEFLWKRYEAKGINPREHFVMVTGKGSPMDEPSKYLQIFYMWDFIGGRYSVSSMVGALPLTFMLGINVWIEFLSGLHEMDEHVRKEKDPMKNMALWGALLGIWNRNFLCHPTFAVIPYSQAMDQYSLHLQQLFMESNGKSVAQEDGSFIDWETCPVIWGTVGTEGQHSYFQAIHQGTDVIPLEFIGFKQSQFGEDEIIEGTSNQEKLLANLFAQALALAKGQKCNNHNKFFEGNRPSHILLADRLEPRTLGNLLAYHEHMVAYQGFIWGVNSFDQEGVQLGKVLAQTILELYKEKRQKGTITKTKANDAGAAFIAALEAIHERPAMKHKKTA